MKGSIIIRIIYMMSIRIPARDHDIDITTRSYSVKGGAGRNAMSNQS